MELQQESWGRNYWGEPQHHSTDTTFSFIYPHGCLRAFQLSVAQPGTSVCSPSEKQDCCVGQDKQAHSSLGCAEPTRAAPTAMPPFPASSITAYSTSGVCSRCLNSPGLVGVSLPSLRCKQRHEIPMDPVETAFCVIHIYLNLTRPLSAD